MFKLEIVMYNKDSKMKVVPLMRRFKALRTVLRLGVLQSRPRIGLYPILHQSNDGLS